ncbi:hypothetical protein C8R47DRAFT_1077698, partial [Mycena vitilis]
MPTLKGLNPWSLANRESATSSNVPTVQDTHGSENKLHAVKSVNCLQRGPEDQLKYDGRQPMCSLRRPPGLEMREKPSSSYLPVRRMHLAFSEWDFRVVPREEAVARPRLLRTSPVRCGTSQFEIPQENLGDSCVDATGGGPRSRDAISFGWHSCMEPSAPRKFEPHGERTAVHFEIPFGREALDHRLMYFVSKRTRLQSRAPAVFNRIERNSMEYSPRNPTAPPSIGVEQLATRQCVYWKGRDIKRMGNIASALLSPVSAPPPVPSLSSSLSVQSVSPFTPAQSLAQELTLPPEVWINIHRFVVSGILPLPQVLPTVEGSAAAPEDPLNELELQR